MLLLLLTDAAFCCHTVQRSADEEGCTGIVDAVFCREDKEGRLSHMAYHNSLTGGCGLFGAKLAASTAHTQCSNPSQPAANRHRLIATRPWEPTAMHTPLRNPTGAVYLLFLRVPSACLCSAAYRAAAAGLRQGQGLDQV